MPIGAMHEYLATENCEGQSEEQQSIGILDEMGSWKECRIG